MRFENASHKFILAGILLLALAPQFYKISLPVWDLNNGFISDDAYYYYKIAHNIRNGFGATFDTYNITNGFHPLWMILCALIALITTDTYLYVKIVLAANLFFTLLLSYKIVTMFRDKLGLFFCAFLVFMMNWPYVSSCNVFSGLETPLYLWMAVTTIDKMTRTDYSAPRDLLILGFLIALTFLARTCFVLFIPVLILFIYGRLAKDKALRMRVIIPYIMLPAILLDVPYVLWNYSLTGHFQQVSGLIKLLWAQSEPWDLMETVKAAFLYNRVLVSGFGLYFRTFPTWVSITINAALVGLILFLGCRHRECVGGVMKDERVRTLVFFAAIQVAFYFFAYRQHIRAWHLAVAMLTVQVVLVHFLKNLYDAFSANRPIRVVMAACACFLAACYLIQVPYYRNHFKSFNYHSGAEPWFAREYAAWLKANLPPTAKYGQRNAGYAAYFSERNIINLDGLVNGKRLYECLANGGGVLQYIVDERIEYLSEDVTEAPDLRTRFGLRLTKIPTVGGSHIFKVYYDSAKDTDLIHPPGMISQDN